MATAAEVSASGDFSEGKHTKQNQHLGNSKAFTELVGALLNTN